MIRRLLIAAVLLAASLFAADQKLGYIYSDQVLKDYEGISEPNATMDKEKASFRQAVDSIYQTLAKAKSDFDAQKLLLSEEGKAAKNAEIEELQREYDRALHDIYGPGGKLEQKTQEVMGPIMQKITDAVEKIAKDEGYAIVFDAAESKMAVLYSTASANLTKEVVDELNREFKPVTPSAVGNRRYAVFPVYEANDEAQKNNDGEQIRALAYDLVQGQPHTEMISATDLNTDLANAGAGGRTNITDDIAYRVGKDIQADYVVYGTVSRSGKKATLQLSVADPRLNKTYPPESGIANRPEDMRQVVSNMVLKLLQKLPQS